MYVCTYVTGLFICAYFVAVGSDYSNMSFELTFTPGVDRVSQSLSIIDDLVKEMNESVKLVLSVPYDNPRPVCIKPPGTATCTIVDNDGEGYVVVWSMHVCHWINVDICIHT